MMFGILLAMVVLGASAQLLRESRRPFVMVALLISASIFLMYTMNRMLDRQTVNKVAAVPVGSAVSDRTH